MNEQEKQDVGTIFQVFSTLPDAERAYFLGYIDGMEAAKKKIEEGR